MKPKTPLKTLHDLKAHYQGLLDGVCDLIDRESGESIKPQKSHGRNGDTPVAKTFAEMTKAEAVSTILKERGEMHSAKIYVSMRKRGHPIKSKNSLANLLSTDKRFEKKGKGIWALAQQQ